jgi:alpha-maltose-1-phosphate synthase
VIRALFVNSGILGQRTFARFIAGAFAADTGGICARQVVLTDELTLSDRIKRRLLCARLWPDGLAGLHNLDFFRYRAELNAGLTARKRIARLEAAGERFDVLHFHHQATAYASLERMRQTPSIVSIDCTQRCVIDRARSAIEVRSYRPNARRDGEIFRAARLIVATSSWAAACVRAEYPDCTTEILAMPVPVQLDAFDPLWIDERYQRAATAGYRPRLLFMGGDFYRKGGDILLSAWDAGHFGRQATLDVVTAYPLDRLPAGVTLHTGVTAYSPEWRGLWQKADIFVLPTRDEAFGMVFQEAAAAGLPSVGTRINAIPELVEDGRNGLLVEPGNLEELRNALEELLASAERRRELGRNAREHAARTTDPSKYRAALVAALHRLAISSGDARGATRPGWEGSAPASQ